MSLTIGVLAIQGDVHENITSTKTALKELGIEGLLMELKLLKKFLILTV